MMDVSSIVDASLALLAAVAVLMTGMWMVSSHSTTVPGTEVQHEAGASAQRLRKAA